jgi:hypothetical protein
MLVVVELEGFGGHERRQRVVSIGKVGEFQCHERPLIHWVKVARCWKVAFEGNQYKQAVNQQPALQFRIKSLALILTAKRSKGPKSLFGDDRCDCRDRIALFSGIVFPKENSVANEQKAIYEHAHRLSLQI